MSFTLLCFLLCLYLTFSRYGKMRLGGEDARPQFSTFSWLAMLFATGMGSGLVFYGAAEPLMHFATPPPYQSDVTDIEKVNTALVYTYFHWGFHAWGIYAIAALTIGYFAFNRESSMRISAPLSRTGSPTMRAYLASCVNNMAIIAIVFGLVASLAQSVLQMSAGLQSQFDVEMDTVYLRLIIIFLLMTCYTASSLTGITRGIKILSNINILIAILFMFFVLGFGPTAYIMDLFTSSMNDYLSRFAALSVDINPFRESTKWTEDWTITYYLWWLAWAPLVGVFIARISFGRTIRTFMIAIIIIPTLFSALWFATLGGAAFNIEFFQSPGFIENISSPQNMSYALIEHLPLSSITPYTMLFLMFIFLVTSADSGAYVLGMLSTEKGHDPSRKQRLFWGLVLGLLTIGALVTGRSTEFFRAFAVIGGIPYLFIMLWQGYALMKALREDTHAISAQNRSTD